MWERKSKKESLKATPYDGKNDFPAKGHHFSCKSQATTPVSCSSTNFIIA